MKRKEIEIAKKLLESKGYNVSKMNESMTPDEVDDAILNGKPFDLDSFRKAHPHGATEEEIESGAIQAESVEVGDIIETDFDQSEIDAGTHVKVLEISSDSWADYVFKCKKLDSHTDTEKDYINLHYDKGDWVGYVIDSSPIDESKEADDYVYRTRRDQIKFDHDVAWQVDIYERASKLIPDTTDIVYAKTYAEAQEKANDLALNLGYGEDVQIVIQYKYGQKSPKNPLKEAIMKAMKKPKNEHLEVAPNNSTTTAEKVAYVKDMVKKAKNVSGTVSSEDALHYAWDIVDFLYDSMLLDKIPLEEAKKMKESSGIPHTEQYKGYSIQSYDDFGATIYKNGKKIKEFENIDDARSYIDGLDEDIVIHKPDDLVGKPNPKFKVTYSTRKGETTTLHVEATSEDSAKAIIRGRCKRNGKTPEFISVEQVSESIKESTMDESAELDYEDMRYWNPVAIGGALAKAFRDNKDAESKIESAINDIINDEYDRGDIESSREKAMKSAQRELDMYAKLEEDDPMNGHKYLVSGATPNITETGTDYNTYDGGYKEDPKSAILTWLKLSQEAPTAISIDTNKNAYADELINWVIDNEEEFRSMCDEYECPYKVDYMINACKKGRSHDFDKDRYHYPDQIHPFDIG